jgi:hypothetical protein
MCLRVSFKKKNTKKKFASLKSLKIRVGCRVKSGSGSISQRYGSEDPDPHQNVTDPQHCLKHSSQFPLLSVVIFFSFLNLWMPEKIRQDVLK